MKNKEAIVIRKAEISDITTLVDFMLKMAKETEDLNLDASVLEAGIAGGLKDTKKAEYFIAENNGNSIGSLMITKEWSDWRNAWVLWIQSVYTVEKYRNKGVYRSLYNHIQQLVKKEENYCGIRLYVDNTNVVAQRVYSKLGMNGEHYTLYEWMLS